MKVTSFLYDTTYNPAMPTVSISVQYGDRQVVVNSLVDSGADATMIPINILSSLGARRTDFGKMRGITGAARSVHIYTVKLQIGNNQIRTVHAIAVEPGEEAILGRDVLNYLVVTLDGPAGVTEIHYS